VSYYQSHLHNLISQKKPCFNNDTLCVTVTNTRQQNVHSLQLDLEDWFLQNCDHNCYVKLSWISPTSVAPNLVSSNPQSAKPSAGLYPELVQSCLQPHNKGKDALEHVMLNQRETYHS
jgi:hypothetical protein